MQNKEFIISGRVQGVGFRYFSLLKAELHQIRGYVKNLPNGSVKIVAMGSPDDMNLFMKELKNGPDSAYVDSFTISVITSIKEYNEFKIQY